MKTKSIIIRISAADKKLIQKATMKFQKETGAKENISSLIRHLLKQYTASTVE
ncbi:MAG TPA: hypothetical protein VMV77_14435 [Bacteroidales bacterium]|nr:hypothetical protein [Bacteroidales bacterium]